MFHSDNTNAIILGQFYSPIILKKPISLKLCLSCKTTYLFNVMSGHDNNALSVFFTFANGHYNTDSGRQV
jgi:hypothetical protein